MSHRLRLLGHGYEEKTTLKSGIYMIVNKENGDVYVGSAKEFKKRWNKHISEFLSRKHNNQRLLRVWEKYGNEKLMWVIVEICEKESLLECEQKWLDRMRLLELPLYNIKLIANSRLGLKCSDETKIKMSISAKIRKMKPQSDEHKNRIRLSNLGRVKSEITKAKISALKMGNTYTTGLTWVHTLKINKRVKPGELVGYLAMGWVSGRLPLRPYRK